jgi:hypothetical protein
MCFDQDSALPIRALAGAAVDHVSLTLKAADGNEFRVVHAWPAEGTGKAIVIPLDVRGIHYYYKERARHSREPERRAAERRPAQFRATPHGTIPP